MRPKEREIMARKIGTERRGGWTTVPGHRSRKAARAAERELVRPVGPLDCPSCRDKSGPVTKVRRDGVWTCPKCGGTD